VTAWGVRWRGEAHIGCGVARGLIVVDGHVGKDRNRCGYWVDAWPRTVRDYDPDLAVVMTGAWEVLDHQVGGTRLRVGSPEYAQHLRREFTLAARLLHARGAQVVFTTVPCYDAPLDRPGAERRNDPRRVAAVNDAIEAVARAEPYVDTFDFDAFLCPHGEFRDEAQGVDLRPDGVHYTEASAAVTWDWLGPRLARLSHAATAARGHPEGRR
jgi:hypothetical protein